MENFIEQPEQKIELQSKEDLVTKEIAIDEIIKFIEKYEDVKKKDYEIEKDYPQMLQALQEGLLVFDENLKPELKLKYPIKNSDNEIAIDVIKFRTRIKPSQLKDIMKGLKISENQVEYSLRCISYITGHSIGMLDKFEKFDYRVMEQIATVFM